MGICIIEIIEVGTVFVVLALIALKGVYYMKGRKIFRRDSDQGSGIFDLGGCTVHEMKIIKRIANKITKRRQI